MVWRYCHEDLAEFKLSIASKFDDDRRAEDLISIVDLAGGAFAESLSTLGPDGIPTSTDIFTLIHQHLSTKTLLIPILAVIAESSIKENVLRSASSRRGESSLILYESDGRHRPKIHISAIMAPT